MTGVMIALRRGWITLEDNEADAIRACEVGSPYRCDDRASVWRKLVTRGLVERHAWQLTYAGRIAANELRKIDSCGCESWESCEICFRRK